MLGVSDKADSMPYNNRCACKPSCHIAVYDTEKKRKTCVGLYRRFKSSRDTASDFELTNRHVYELQRIVLTTLTLAPNARGGRLERNFDLTTPDDPCGLVTRLIVQ